MPQIKKQIKLKPKLLKTSCHKQKLILLSKLAILTLLIISSLQFFHRMGHSLSIGYCSNTQTTLRQIKLEFQPPPPPHRPQGLEKIGIVNRAGEVFKANPNSYPSWLLYIVFVPFRLIVNAIYDVESDRRQFRSQLMLERSLHPIPHLSWMGFTSTPLARRVSTTDWHLPRQFAICLCEDWILCYCSCWPSTWPEGGSG